MFFKCCLRFILDPESLCNGRSSLPKVATLTSSGLSNRNKMQTTSINFKISINIKKGNTGEINL